MTTFPRVPGRDFAGVVADTGSAPSAQALLGKAVYGSSGSAVSFTQDGVQAEYALLDATGVAMKPANLSAIQAASVGVPFSTAAIALTRAEASKGETVLVLGGTGAVGDAVVQMAKQIGCKVLVAGRAEGVDVDLRTDPDLEMAKRLTQGFGVDVVVDTTGIPRLIGAGIAILAKRGRLAFMSAPKNGQSTELQGVDLLTMYRMEKKLIGINSLLYSGQEMAEKMEELRPAFENGTLEAPPEARLRVISIGDAAQAYGQLEAKSKDKFVIAFNS